ncbi:MAG: hypothetical protein ACQETL_03230 [Bacteroidota bacterium]
MKLFLTQGWSGTERFIKEKPEESEISKLLKSLNWKDFNSVRLQQDSENWIDVSGNLGNDGLSIVLEENGISYVSYKAPRSINQLDEALKLYINNNSALKDKWFKDDQPNTESPNRYNYDSWKEQFMEKQKAEKKRLKFSIIIAVILVGFVSTFLYLFFNDELKFIGHDTTELTAIVTKIEVIPAYRGFRQSVKYKFTYNGKSFVGYFIAGRSETRYSEYDKVIIKIASDDPTISKKIARLKTKYNFINQNPP